MAAPPSRKKRSSTTRSPRDGGPEEAASYISEALIELARLARRHKLDMLGFLLDMALMEAKDIVRPGGKRPPPKA